MTINKHNYVEYLMCNNNGFKLLNKLREGAVLSTIVQQITNFNSKDFNTRSSNASI